MTTLSTTSVSLGTTQTPNANTSSHGKQRGSMTRTSGQAKNSHGTRPQFSKGQRSNGRSSTPTAPQKLYVSKCCSAPANKPACGKKENVQEAESKKMKEQA